MNGNAMRYNQTLLGLGQLASAQVLCSYRVQCSRSRRPGLLGGGEGYMKEPDGIDTSSQSPHPKEISRPLDRIVKSLQPDPRT